MKKMHTGFCALAVVTVASATLCGPAFVNSVHAAPAKAQKAATKSVLLSVSGMH